MSKKIILSFIVALSLGSSAFAARLDGSDRFDCKKSEAAKSDSVKQEDRKLSSETVENKGGTVQKDDNVERPPVYHFEGQLGRGRF